MTAPVDLQLTAGQRKIMHCMQFMHYKFTKYEIIHLIRSSKFVPDQSASARQQGCALSANITGIIFAPLAAMQMIKLAFELLLTKSGDLDPMYIKGVSDVQHLSIIQQHLSSACNACLTRPLESWAEATGEPTMRLLRLTSRSCYY